MLHPIQVLLHRRWVCTFLLTLLDRKGNNPTLHGYVPDVNTWLDVFGLDIIKVNPSDPFPKSEKGKTWKEKFIERFNDKRNIEAGGVVSPTGFKSKPTLACK